MNGIRLLIGGHVPSVLLQFRNHCQMSRIQEVLRAAADIQLRPFRCLRVLFHHVHVVHFGARHLLRIAEHVLPHQPAFLRQVLQVAHDVHRTAEAGSRGKAFRVGQRQAHRTVSAHAQTGHIRILRLVAQPQEPVHRLRQFLAHIIPVAFPMQLVAVEAVVHRRHDHRQVMVRGIPLHGSAPHPDGMVIAVSVQQVQHLGQLLRGGRAHADALVGLRQDHVHRGGHIQHGREKLDL